MKYKIIRTSYFDDDFKQPCDKAYRGDDNEFGFPQWYIDINCLEDLQALIEEVKYPLVVSDDTIEIDDVL